ncbi:MAG: hypothetical protein WBH44_02175 [Proteocatella sp.]
MIYIRNQFVVFMKRLTLKKIVIYTTLETTTIIAMGYFLTLLIPEFRILTVDFICVIIIINLFEMLSVIKYTIVNEDSYQDEIIHWLKFFVFTSVSFAYILISLGLLPEEIYAELFFNLKTTSLLIMVLLLGLDLTLDKIYEYTQSEVSKIE